MALTPWMSVRRCTGTSIAARPPRPAACHTEFIASTGTRNASGATLEVMGTALHRLTTTLAVAALATLAACSPGPDTLIGYVPPTTKSVASVTVTEIVDGAPRPFSFRAGAGEILVVIFGYTNCPDICPATLANLKNARKKLGDDASRVDIAMVTVDPERDTPAIMPRYLSSFTDRFHAVIPSSQDELRAAEDVFQASSSVTKVDGRIEVSHTGTAYAVNELGEVVVEWPFGIDVPSLVSDLEMLLA